ncbi:MAG: alpha/beta hydrolase-fold protein [Bacteroidota bacterium]
MATAVLLLAWLVAGALPPPARARMPESPRAFSLFLERIERLENPAERDSLAAAFTRGIAVRGLPVVEDTVVHFLYSGVGGRVSVPSDLNGWNPSADTMRRIGGTDLFHLAVSVPRAARFEYKLVVDSVWMLDPFNTLQAQGGYGPNSEIRMPDYVSSPWVLSRSGVRRGRLDTLHIRSSLLGRTHPATVYLPPSRSGEEDSLGLLLVMDGGEYLSLGFMQTVLDNLLDEGKIRPILAVFLDPRTDPGDSRTSMRMQDYAMSDTFVAYLTEEVLPALSARYRVLSAPAEHAVMGASLGGLIATYAAFRRPDLFGLCAAQSPAYWWDEERMMRLMAAAPPLGIRFYLDTGTIRDARVHTRRMADILQDRGVPCTYAEYPEGHNWVNWRARIDDILIQFWETKP